MYNVNAIIERIKSASLESPIAVFFGAANPDGKLNAVFASTALSQLRIKRGDADLIGVWHKGNFCKEVEDMLKDCANQQVADYKALSLESADKDGCDSYVIQ